MSTNLDNITHYTPKSCICEPIDRAVPNLFQLKWQRMYMIDPLEPVQSIHNVLLQSILCFDYCVAALADHLLLLAEPMTELCS